MFRKPILSLLTVFACVLFLGCPTPIDNTNDTEVDIAVVPGVTTPLYGATPVTTVTETAQYTGMITWSPAVSATFAADTAYTATITLKAKSDFSFKGVAADFFTVAGATSVTNAKNSGVVTAVFPATGTVPDSVINITAIPGIAAPAFGATPVTMITDTAQYTGTITWSGSPTTFAASTVYTATIMLTAKPGYTVAGVAENSFTVAGATSTNAVNSGIVTAVFPATGAVPATVVTITAISGVSAPIVGATPVTTISETAQYAGMVAWSPLVSGKFGSDTYITATITLTPKAGYTLSGVTANSFTVAGASATNSIDSGVITATFTAVANLATVSDVTSISQSTIILKGVQGGTFNNGRADMTVSSFRMSQHEITGEQYASVMGVSNPSSIKIAANQPVETVKWYQILVFCNKLSVADGLTPVYSVGGTTDTAVWGSIPTSNNATWSAVSADWSANGYRLPTEAEWHFAARGGNSSHNYVYAGSDTIDAVAWYTGNSGSYPHPVGGKNANDLGLYDMSGNIGEFCWDWHVILLPATAQTDYRGAASGTTRVFRGGYAVADASDCTVTSRAPYYPYKSFMYLGFRVVRP